MKKSWIIIALFSLLLLLPGIKVEAGEVLNLDVPGATVLCLGDSLTRGYAPLFQTPDGKKCSIISEVGRWTQDILNEFRSRGLCPNKAHPPNEPCQDYTTLIIMGGTNDVVGGRNPDNAIRNLGLIYAAAKAAGMRVVAVTMPPAGGSGAYTAHAEEIQRGMDRVNSFVRSAAVDAVVDAYQLMGDPTKLNFYKPAFGGGGLHPNLAGYQFLAQTIAAQGFGGAAPAGAEEATLPLPAFIPKIPQLIVNIPGFKGFSEIKITEDGRTRTLDIPFLVEYIQAIYNYVLGIIGIVATVMIVYGGIRWLTAAGNATTIGEAKKGISNAVFGMLIALGSYLILFTINPELVKLRSLQVVQIPPEVFDDGNYGGGFEGGAPSAGGQSSSYTGFDELFQRYAGCIGVDWRVLKAIAYTESSFNPNIVNPQGFVGLFQTKCSTCCEGQAQCSVEHLKDPEYNTQSIIPLARDGVEKIRSACPNLTDPFLLVSFIYFNHNSGTGALGWVLRRVGCGGTPQEYVQAAAAYWSGRCDGSISPQKCVPNSDGRMVVAQRTARGAMQLLGGVTNPLTSGTCTPTTDTDNAPPPLILPHSL